jgi:hypothetical protein
MMSKPVNKIVIATYKHDFWLAEICMASIKYWHPEIPIALLYDFSCGPVDFRKAQQRYGFEVIDLPIKKFGWGLSKIEYLFHHGNERVLVLDADTILLGPVLDYLNSFEDEFIVCADNHTEPDAPWMATYYYDYKALQAMDDRFLFPGYSFNTGQFVATTGIVKREDFNHLIDWKEFPAIIHRQIFACADQGILNYVLPLKEQQGEVSIGRADFMLGIRYAAVKEVTVDDQQQKKGRYMILHWAGGGTTKTLRFMQRNDLLKFYRNLDHSFFDILQFELEDWVRYLGFQKKRVLRKFNYYWHGSTVS